MTKYHAVLSTLGVALVLAFAGPARGQDAGADRVVLKVDGRVRGGAPMQFTRADLERLGVATIRTGTPWHDGVQLFEGVPLDALMRHVGADGSRVRVVALNKYQTEIPLEDFAALKPILALKRGGRYMEVPDKGPLFVVYPYDERPELKSERYYGRSAWQVRSMTVE